jgi:hypothetical protein
MANFVQIGQYLTDTSFPIIVIWRVGLRQFQARLTKAFCILYGLA